MNVWLTRHLQTCVGSLGRLASQPLPTLLTVLVIGIALALPACLQVLVSNANAVSGDLNRSVDLTVYFKPNAVAAKAEQVATTLRARQDIASVQLISAEAALKTFRERSGFGPALDALNNNPLPHTIVVKPANDAINSAQLEALANELRALPEVDIVQLDTAWVERFNAILDALRRGVLVVAILLALGVLVIVGNTIRTEIQNRRAEIEITKLVGGTDAFVRRPFLYTGIWYGFGGGLIALLLSYLVVILMAAPIRRLSSLYGSDFALAGLGLKQGAMVVGVGILLGWLGSLTSATRHLRDIEPQ
jgi:cell division transport system permease protein